MLSSSAQGLDARDKGKFTAEANHFIWKKKKAHRDLEKLL